MIFNFRNKKRSMMTNAPRQWPSLSLTRHEYNTYGEFLIHFSSALLGSFKSAEDLKVEKILYMKMFDDGLFQIPLQVKDKKNNKYCIFPYLDNNKECAEHWAGVKQVMAKYDMGEPIFYSFDYLSEAEPKDVLKKMFDSDVLTVLENDPPEGAYSMWWAEKEPESFRDSEVMVSLEKIYTSVNGIEEYYFLSLLHQWNILGNKFRGQGKLPEKQVVIPLLGPEDQVVMFSASKEKGLRFHFHPKNTTIEYRDKFIKQVSQEFERLRDIVIKEFKCSKESIKESDCYGWWQTVRSFVKHSEQQGENTVQFGTVNFELKSEDENVANKSEAFVIGEK